MNIKDVNVRDVRVLSGGPGGQSKTFEVLVFEMVRDTLAGLLLGKPGFHLPLTAPGRRKPGGRFPELANQDRRIVPLHGVRNGFYFESTEAFSLQEGGRAFAHSRELSSPAHETVHPGPGPEGSVDRHVSNAE